MTTFGERMQGARVTLGARGARTMIAAFARELGVPRHRLYGWEVESKAPKGGIDFLADCFARVEGVRSRGISPRALAAWALTGEGAAPFGVSGQPETRDPAREPELAQGDVLASLLVKVREGALDVREATATIRGLFKAGLAVALLSSGLVGPTQPLLCRESKKISFTSRRRKGMSAA